MLGKHQINNADDIIDSRDVITRISELEAIDPEDRDEEEQEELTVLKYLEEEASVCADWQHGEALIRDDYFETYARELAEDIGAVKADSAWPGRHIDWRAASEELQQDYTSVEYDGVSYWIRS